MSSFKSDQDFRRTARQLGVDEKTLRRWLNTADPDELLPRAPAVVVDNGNSLEKHLGEAVWYIKEDRVREEDALLQRTARAVGRWPQGDRGCGPDLRGQ